MATDGKFVREQRAATEQIQVALTDPFAAREAGMYSQCYCLIRLAIEFDALKLLLSAGLIGRRHLSFGFFNHVRLQRVLNN